MSKSSEIKQHMKKKKDKRKEKRIKEGGRIPIIVVAQSLMVLYY